MRRLKEKRNLYVGTAFTALLVSLAWIPTPSERANQNQSNCGQV